MYARGKDYIIILKFITGIGSKLGSGIYYTGNSPRFEPRGQGGQVGI